MKHEIEFGHHPDADQISAFVEHALPTHEQAQMLAHLAVCPECRATVAMSLPPEEVPAVSAVQTPRTRWSALWRFAIPATALAAITLFIVYIHHVSTLRQPLNPPAETAVSHPPASPAAAPPSINSSHAQDEKSKAIEPVKKAAQPRAPIASDALVMQDQIEPSTADRVLNTPQSLPRAASAPPPQNARAEEIAKPSSQQSDLTTITEEPLRDKTAPQAAGANVATGGPSLKKAEEIPAQLSLPSRLPILSMATHLHQVLAIDTRNDLFLSEDGGTTWRPVPVKWKGRAVKADLVSYGASPATNATVIAGQEPQSTNFASASSVPAPQLSANAPEQPGISLAGTVSDQSGAVISGATVTATASNGRLTRTTTSDANGHFILSGLTPGAYDMKTQARGFQELLTQGVNVRATQPNVANVVLSVGSAAETVTVQAESTNLDVLRSPEPPPTKAAHKRQSSVPVFEITTDNGDLWTSSDGMKWKQK
jgi:Carboxypeptidase regulatory-like domain/Putative zinc-finger